MKTTLVIAALTLGCAVAGNSTTKATAVAGQSLFCSGHTQDDGSNVQFTGQKPKQGQVLRPTEKPKQGKVQQKPQKPTQKKLTAQQRKMVQRALKETKRIADKAREAARKAKAAKPPKS